MLLGFVKMVLLEPQHFEREDDEGIRESAKFGSAPIVGWRFAEFGVEFRREMEFSVNGGSLSPVVVAHSPGWRTDDLNVCERCFIFRDASCVTSLIIKSVP